MKILLADDSATIRMILKGLLKQLQIVDILEAANGQTALNLAAENAVDLILLDIHMPVMDGLACLEKLKSQPLTAAIPVILISSDTDEKQIESARKFGAGSFVKKPFKVEGLREAIDMAVSERVQH